MYRDRNFVKDGNKLQGVYHKTDLFRQIRRSLNSRSITVENGPTEVDIFISTEMRTPSGEGTYRLRPQESLHLAINSQGEASQFLHVLDPVTKKPLGDPTILRRDSNSFVIRQGLNKYWVQAFYTRS